MSGQALSESEERVVRMVVEGQSNAEVAKAIGVTKKTVKFHLTNIYAKLGVMSRAQLIVKRLSERESDGEFAKLMREMLK